MRDENMKSKILKLVMMAAIALGCTANLHAQAFAKIQGKCTGVDGKPMVGAKVELLNADNGRKYDAKTDKKGGYFYPFIDPGTYKVTLLQDDKPVTFFDKVQLQITPDGNPTQVDFDLPKQMAMQGMNASSSGGGSGAPGPRAKANQPSNAQVQQQIKQQEEKNAKNEAERQKIAQLNTMLKQAIADEQAKNFDQAIAVLNQTVTIDPTKDILWANLGLAQLQAGQVAETAGTRDVAKDHYQKSVDAYTKANTIKPNDASYLNNLGQGYAKTGQPQKALEEYTQSAQLDPANAALYYFNLGATLTNQATFETNATTKQKELDDADVAFDKAVTAKPDYAEAWYQKGINLLSKATYSKSGKMIPASGTTEAFQKYLDLAPTGVHAADAKSMIASLEEKVETTYKKK